VATILSRAAGFYRAVAIAETVPPLRQRPIFKRLCLHLGAQIPEAPRFRDRAEQAELQRESGLHLRRARRLAGLVVDDGDATIRQPVDPVGGSG
jgi:hypothetical protein